MRSVSAILAIPVIASALGAAPAGASSIDGMWRSPNDDDGSYLTVRVHPCQDAPQERCAVVTGAHRGAKEEAVGRQVMRVEPRPDGTWEGEILQPLKGHVYDSRIRPVGENVMEVDGCIIGGLLCRTQRWTRLD